MEDLIKKIEDLVALWKGLKMGQITPKTLPGIKQGGVKPGRPAKIPGIAPTNLKSPTKVAGQIKNPDIKDQAMKEAQNAMKLIKYHANGQWELVKEEKSENDKAFDRCVEHVKDSGKPEDSAYAICTDSVKKAEIPTGYHIHVEGKRITDKPQTLKEIHETHGKAGEKLPDTVKRLESSGHMLVPHYGELQKATDPKTGKAYSKKDLYNAASELLSQQGSKLADSDVKASTAKIGQNYEKEKKQPVKSIQAGGMHHYYVTDEKLAHHLAPKNEDGSHKPGKENELKEFVFSKPQYQFRPGKEKIDEATGKQSIHPVSKQPEWERKPASLLKSPGKRMQLRWDAESKKWMPQVPEGGLTADHFKGLDGKQELNPEIEEKAKETLNELTTPPVKKSELSEGIKHEQEHKDTLKELRDDAANGTLKPLEHYIKNIAEDHLDEIKDYYTRLDKLEADAKKDKVKS